MCRRNNRAPLCPARLRVSTALAANGRSLSAIRSGSIREPSASTAASGASWPSAANSARPIPCDERRWTWSNVRPDARHASARVRVTLTTGMEATRRLVTSSCRLRAMVFCGFSWSAVEGCRGLVELAAFHVAARQARERAFIRRRDLRQLEVGGERLRTEVTRLRILDRALLQFLDGRHHYSVSAARTACTSRSELTGVSMNCIHPKA